MFFKRLVVYYSGVLLSLRLNVDKCVIIKHTTPTHTIYVYIWSMASVFVLLYFTVAVEVAHYLLCKFKSMTQHANVPCT